MKHIWLTIFFILFTIVAVQAQGQESFSKLNTLKINTSDSSINSFIKFEGHSSEVINKKFEKLPDFLVDYCGNDNVRLIRTKINSRKDKYYVITFGAYDGWLTGFTIYEEEKPNRIVGQIKANSIIVPGDGNVYAVSRYYENFEAKKKFSLIDNQLKEVKQPFYSVNLTSYALRPISIYSDIGLSNEIAIVPEDESIEIILSTDTDSKSDIYLVRTSIGLIGWAKLRAGQYKSVDVEGLYYWGD
ncbi:hypothetical protein RCC89_19610 [Cytophagaceae bacterium ABcell3]|nr:hypothetical protein RCC89_19610 [Cytophagaceae bacterium ABcell3]